MTRRSAGLEDDPARVMEPGNVPLELENWMKDTKIHQQANEMLDYGILHRKNFDTRLFAPDYSQPYLCLR